MAVQERPENRKSALVLLFGVRLKVSWKQNHSRLSQNIILFYTWLLYNDSVHISWTTGLFLQYVPFGKTCAFQMLPVAHTSSSSLPCYAQQNLPASYKCPETHRVIQELSASAGETGPAAEGAAHWQSVRIYRMMFCAPSLPLCILFSYPHFPFAQIDSPICLFTVTCTFFQVFSNLLGE